MRNRSGEGNGEKHQWSENECDQLLANKLCKERASLIYDFDKVKPENQARYYEIQAELLKIEARNNK